MSHTTAPESVPSLAWQPPATAMKARGAGEVPAIFAVWAIGFISGEWRGVEGLPRYQMIAAIALLILAAAGMACGNSLAAN